MLASPDQQISLTDPDSRSWRRAAAFGRRRLQRAGRRRYLIVAMRSRTVAQSGNNLPYGKQAKGVLKTEGSRSLPIAVLSSPEILPATRPVSQVTLPSHRRSGAKSEGRFGKQDFV